MIVHSVTSLIETYTPKQARRPRWWQVLWAVRRKR